MTGKRGDPIDVKVGKRVRLARTLIQMSQTQLGEAVGLTFQQIQKYESGSNRIGAARLFRFSQILNVPITYFYEDMVGKAPSARGEDAPSEILTKFLSTNESFQLIAAFAQITNPNVRKRVLNLVTSLSETPAAMAGLTRKG